VEEAVPIHFDILTLFPGLFAGVFEESIIKRAREAGLLTIALHNIRDYATGRHRVTDDTPYGGGGGMVMKPEPIFAAVEALLGEELGSVPVVLLTPQGRLFTQQVARELAHDRRLVLLCGRYEGVDERVCQYRVTDEISIGDYVLSGGEVPAMVIVEAVTRLIPGVLGDPGASFEDSHAEGLLEYPHYTRPPLFRGHAIPEVLLSGHHAEIVRWRRRQALRRTWERRPDLLRHARLSPEDLTYLRQLEEEQVSQDAPSQVALAGDQCYNLPGPS
jgi:tRNA (guanine37-N1)-methyltransferase